MEKKLNDHKTDRFPGFPPEPVTNYWPYPKALNGWWHILSGSEQKCLDYILRHTLGFNKMADYISLSQFEKGVRNLDRGTGLSFPSIINALDGLEKKGFIKSVKKIGKTTNYELLKNLKGSPKESLRVTPQESLDTIKDNAIITNNIISASRELKTTYKEEITLLIDYLSNKLKRKFPNYGKQTRATKSMLIAGYATDEIKQAVDNMLENEWWQERGFDMKNVADQIPRLLSNIKRRFIPCGKNGCENGVIFNETTKTYHECECKKQFKNNG